MLDTAGIDEDFKGAVPSFWGKPLLIHEGFLFLAKWDGIYRTKLLNYMTNRVFENKRNTVSGSDWYFFVGRKATLFAGFAGRLFISNDTGGTWAELSNVCNYPTAACFPDPNNDSIVLVAEYNAGVYRSNDCGATWSAPITAMPRINTFASWKGILFAGIKGLGMQISHDTGATWSDFNNGLPTIRFITDLLVEDTLLYSGTDGSSVWVFNLNELSSASIRKTGKSITKGRSLPSWKLAVDVDKGKSILSQRSMLIYDLAGRRVSGMSVSNGIKCVRGSKTKR
jgi:hypothetical protein